MRLLVSFFSGVLAFFSPCFLPIIPAYLIYITGLSFAELKNVCLKTIFHSLCFILGFTIIFTILGAASGFIGSFLIAYKDIFRYIGAMLIIFFGLYLLGWFRVSWLDLDKKLSITNKPSGYFGSIFVGMVFALGWTPCIGPILGGILVLASQQGTVWQGMLQLIVFSLGLGLPLFLFSLAVNFSLSLLKTINKYVGLVQKLCGLGLVMVGVLLLVGRF